VSPVPASPPKFMMWHPVKSGEDMGWQRRWFGRELDPTAPFNLRGLGIREPMFNPDVYRPVGTGDWLIMFFHEPARLERRKANPSVGPNTLIIWPPGAAQFYSWGKAANVEPHSWMHIEGTWVAHQVEENHLPVNTPVHVDDDVIMVGALQCLMGEMTHEAGADQTILPNIFQNWARSIARHLRTRDTKHRTPPGLLKARAYLEEHFSEITPLDELADIACMSRSHLCHQFKAHFGATVSSYVIRKRMAIAQRMLFDMDLRPGDIAEGVGYSDIYQFSKQFKKSFGVSPTQYRKEHISPEED
jgi:AraC family transcriptional regulator of arabinose operon